MNRFRSGMIPLFALMALVGCNSEPTDSIRGDISELVASPTQLFIELGGTKTVEVGAVDEQGNPLDLAYEVTSTGAGITVRRDSSFLPIFVDDTTLRAPATGPRFRFIVQGTGYASTSFTVSAGGEEIVVPVQVVPQAGIAATFDNPTPALGDTITITAAPGTSFTQTAALEIPGGTLQPIIIDRSEDGNSIRFLAPPNVNGPITITEVTSVSAPGLIFSPATQTALQTPLIDTVDVVYSTTSAALGDLVTVTIPEPLIKVGAPDTTIPFQIQFENELTGPAAGAANETPSADSSSFTFEAPANVAGAATVVNFVFPGGYQIALPTRPTFTSTTTFESTIDATFSDNEPDILQVITLTAPAGFFFSADTLSVTIGGQPALIQSVAPDGSSVDLIPIPGSAGSAEIAGVSPTGLPQFIYTMNTIDGVTVPGITPLEGTESLATAPELTVPTVGNSFVLNDAGAFAGDPTDCCFGFHPRFYKIVLAAPTTLTFTIDWFQGQDLGVYITEADGTTLIDAGDSAGEGPDGHPESVTIPLVAGTYYVAAVNFSASNPSFFQLTISNP